MKNKSLTTERGVDVNAEVARRILAQHALAMAQTAHADRWHTAALMVGCGDELQVWFYCCGDCGSTREALDHMVSEQLERGLPWPETALMWGACDVVGCPCQGELGFSQVKFPSAGASA